MAPPCRRTASGRRAPWSGRAPGVRVDQLGDRGPHVARQGELVQHRGGDGVVALRHHAGAVFFWRTAKPWLRVILVAYPCVTLSTSSTAASTTSWTVPSAWRLLAWSRAGRTRRLDAWRGARPRGWQPRRRPSVSSSPADEAPLRCLRGRRPASGPPTLRGAGHRRRWSWRGASARGPPAPRARSGCGCVAAPLRLRRASAALEHEDWVQPSWIVDVGDPGLSVVRVTECGDRERVDGGDVGGVRKS